MQRKQEKREEIEPYKEKNVQNLKNGEKHEENEEVALWLDVLGLKEQNMQSDYILSFINIV